MTVQTTAEDAALDKSFDPQRIEAKLYAQWSAMGCFHAGQQAGAAPYCIQLPPPNVTGTLHMGHAFNQTIMDTLTRWQRMKGANALWLPGTDHAGIATQMVVERQLEATGISRQDLGRQAFIEKVWDWKQISGSSITGQMRRLGASADWNLEYFTMDEKRSTVVREAFIRLYQQGLIYRGKRLINWDPILMTAVSDLEVVSEEEQGSIWEIHYPLADGSGQLTVATTRPETMLGDSAVMVHPDDARYQHVIGKSVILPLSNREIPVIADVYVDPNFGTGVVKVTPAHDFNDYAVGQRHQLAMMCIFKLDASLNDDVPEAYRGLDRFEARRRIVQDLETIGALGAIKAHRLMIPRGDRSGAVIEPMLTDQWFVAMSKPAPEESLFPGKSMAELALEVVREGKMRFVPSNWATTYNHWLENIQDWTISRQLWWGHQIPAWYRVDANGEAIYNGPVYVARDLEHAHQQAQAEGWDGGLIRDPDVLDTWFSSALVPFSTLADDKDPWPADYSQGKVSEPGLGLGIRLKAELAQFLPSQVLVTGFDIIFFWVARMVMMTTHFTGKVPFETVYVHALVRDAEGQKMSKSKGNTLDPIDLIDGIELEDLLSKRTSGLMNVKQADAIVKRTRKEFPQGIPAFGADALRFTFASLATPGRNINFDLNRCEGYRNFCNKLWNATRFVLMQVQGADTYELGFAPHDASQCHPGGYMHFAQPERWISSVLEQSIAIIEAQLCDFRFDLAAKAYYELVWNAFCDWYLELAKVQLQDDDPALRRGTRRTLVSVLETILRLGHPIMPFITETLWQSVAPLAQRYAANPAEASAQNPDQKTPSKGMRCSIMQQPFPVARLNRVDASALSWMNRFRSVVDACRQLRSEMDLSPAQRVPLMLEGEQAAEVLRDAKALQAMARLAEVQLVEKLPSDRHAPVQWLEGMRLMLDVAIDPAAERLRLTKEIERIDLEITKCKGKLDNPSFAERAPQAVVDQERERLLRFEQGRAALITQSKRFESAD